jgi:hypothetical protein
MPRRPVLVLGLTLSACAHSADPAPAPVPAPAPAPVEPAPAEPAPAPVAALPAWDDVPSPVPPGATNPPRPVLVVTPDGAHCYKQWVSPMMRNPAMGQDRVEACTEDCGTEIACDDRAKALLGSKPE